MSTNFERIKDWSDERLITQNEPDRNGFVSMIVEELGEFLEAGENIEGRIDAMADIIVFAYGEMAKYGYHGDKVMDEVIKEISSRTGAYDPVTKKWQKFKTPEAQAMWYTANFSGCKINEETHAISSRTPAPAYDVSKLTEGPRHESVATGVYGLNIQKGNY